MKWLMWIIGAILCIVGLTCFNGCSMEEQKINSHHKNSNFISEKNPLYALKTTEQNYLVTSGGYLLIGGYINSKKGLTKYGEFYFIAKDSSVCYVKLPIENIRIKFLQEGKPYCKIFSYHTIQKDFINWQSYIYYVEIYLREEQIINRGEIKFEL